MPSSQLSLLCEQIEAQNTDHFGKFYMYVSLLNSVSVRNKSFAAGLPKYSKGFAFWRDNHLDLGSEIPVGLSQEVELYARQFVNAQPNWSTVLYNIAMSYIRRGKISDLTYIIDQMLNHLKAIHGPQSHNQNIYDYVEFEAKQASIIQFIEQISTFNQHLLAFADTACNIVLSVAAAAIGLVLVLASVFFLASSLLGFALLIGGAYSAYSFIAQLEGQVNQLEKQMMQIVDKAQKLPEDTSLLGTKNHHAFFSSIFIPLPYTALTAVEQLVFDESIQNRLSEERGNLEKITTMLAQL